MMGSQVCVSSLRIESLEEGLRVWMMGSQVCDSFLRIGSFEEGSRLWMMEPAWHWALSTQCGELL